MFRLTAYVLSYAVMLSTAAFAGQGADTQTVGKDDMRGIVYQTLSKCMKGFDPSSVVDLRLPEDVVLPAGQLAHNVQDGRVEPDGKFSMRIAFSVGGEEKRSAWIWGKVKRTVKVLVAARPMKRMTTVTDDDVQLAEVEARADSDGALSDPPEAIGMVLTRQLASGTPIKAEFLRQQKVINRGDAVKIIAKAPGLMVTALGKAREDGLLGGLVKVENIKSGKVVTASVVSDGVVEVGF